MPQYSQDDVETLLTKMDEERGKLLRSAEALSPAATDFVFESRPVEGPRRVRCAF